jgi:hypothetical protein
LSSGEKDNGRKLYTEWKSDRKGETDIASLVRRSSDVKHSNEAFTVRQRTRQSCGEAERGAKVVTGRRRKKNKTARFFISNIDLA